MSERVTRVYRALALVLTAASVVACSTTGAAGRPHRAEHATRTRAVAPEPRTPDDIFVALRDASNRNDAPAAIALAAQLDNYEIPSYVQYFQIKPRMYDTDGKARVDAPDDEIRAFLRKYDGQAIADRLRNDWLLVLGKRHDWKTFDAEYPKFVLNDDTQVKCYALMSRASKGENVGDAARSLLTEPRRYGDGCVDMINMLAQLGQLSTADVWNQIRWAYEGNYLMLGKEIANALGGQRPDDAQFDMAANKPAILLANGIGTDPAAHQLALLAITRLARTDALLASTTLSGLAGLTPAEQAIAWGEVAYAGALQQQPQAVDWYRRADGAPLSVPAQEWRVRAALRVGDWPTVRRSIEAMRDPLRDDDAWVYWYGRALREARLNDAARVQFEKIACKTTFYGQLAQEALGGKITIPPVTVVSPAEVDAMRSNPGFLRAEKFYDLNLRFEGNREWNWELRKMTDRQLLAAAQYADSIKLYDRAVNTADRTRTEHNFKLRYLMPFRAEMQRNADAVGLDLAWAYGLIRQESRFIINARSSVGAGGLMQLMPATARMVARKIGMPYDADSLHDIDTNITLGTNYLSMIYNQFDGSAVLASAGYNAGPARPRSWRTTLTRPVEGAIFAETIPFHETRHYVENVLANTTYYAALISGQPQSLRDRLGVILPEQ